MPVHTRDPLSLSYNDYKGWIRLEALKWFGDHSGDSDFPSHILGDLTDLTAKIDAYDAAYTPYFGLIELANARNKLYSTSADNLGEKLQQIKYALPTIAPDPEILALFNLAGSIPTDRDLLQIVAENALTYWATVAIDPLFAPVVGDFTTLQTLFDDFIAAQANYIDTDDQREATQNLVLSTREAIHEIERKVFTWYRGRHMDGRDEWWTNTPWGCTGGSSGGGEEPEPPENWDDPPTGLTLKEGPPGFANISATIHPDADGAAIYLAEGPLGEDAQPFMPPEPHEPQVPLPFGMPVNHGVRSWIWVCAVKDGVLGKVTGPVWVEPTL